MRSKDWKLFFLEKILFMEAKIMPRKTARQLALPLPVILALAGLGLWLMAFMPNSAQASYEPAGGEQSSLSLCANEGALIGNCSDDPFTYTYVTGSIEYGPFTATGVTKVGDFPVGSLVSIRVAPYTDTRGIRWTPLYPVMVIEIGYDDTTWYATYFSNLTKTYIPLVFR